MPSSTKSFTYIFVDSVFLLSKSFHLADFVLIMILTNNIMDSTQNSLYLMIIYYGVILNCSYLVSLKWVIVCVFTYIYCTLTLSVLTLI